METKKAMLDGYRLSDLYLTEDIHEFTRQILVDYLRGHNIQTYNDKNPHNRNAKKDDKLLMALYKKIIDHKEDDVKQAVTFDKCFDNLIKSPQPLKLRNDLHANFCGIVKTLISRYKKTNNKKYMKARKELEQLGMLNKIS